VQVGAGKIRALATGIASACAACRRARSRESVPGFSNDGWYGLVAPARTSPSIINKLNAEMNRARIANAEFSSTGTGVWHGADQSQHAAGVARMDGKRASRDGRKWCARRAFKAQGELNTEGRTDEFDP
jgi:hypothetical protein